MDENAYEKGIKVSGADMAGLNLTPTEFHGGWNYTIARLLASSYETAGAASKARNRMSHAAAPVR